MLQMAVMEYLQILQVEQKRQVDDKLSIHSQQVEHSQWYQVVILISLCSFNMNLLD